MWAAIHRQDSLRSGPVWLLHSGVTTSVLLGLLAWRHAATDGAAVPRAWLLAVAWVSLAIYLIAGRVHRRCPDLELTLPIPGRRLWLAHVMALVVSTAGLVAVMIGVIAIPRWALGVATLPGSAADLLALTLLILSGVALAVVLIESRRLELQSPAFDWRDVLWRLAAVAMVLAPSLALASRPWLAVVVLLAGATVLGAWAYRRIPTSLLVADSSLSLGPAAAGGGWTENGSLGAVGFVTRLFVITHGARFGVLAPILMMPFIVVCGAIAAGGLELWAPLEDLRFLYIPLFAYMLFNSVPAGMEQLSYLDPLPIGRRTAFAFLVVPLLVCFVLGYGAGRLAVRAFGTEAPPMVYRAEQNEDHHRLGVAMRFNRIAWGGTAPLIESPWGESRQPKAAALVRGSRWRVYSPYTTPEGSSAELVALQISRAVEAVYGRRIEPGEIQRRYLETTPDGVRARTGSLTIERDYGLERPGDAPVAPVVLALSVAPFLLLTALFQRVYRPGVADRTKRIAWIAILAATMALLFLQLALAIAGVMESWAPGALIQIPLQQSDGPLLRVLAWAIAIAVCAFAYRVAEASFLDSELPVKPVVVKPF